MLDAVWITRTPPINREMTPTMTIDDITSRSISMMNCFLSMLRFSGLRNTCLRKSVYFPIELNMLAFMLFSFFLLSRRS